MAKVKGYTFTEAQLKKAVTEFNKVMGFEGDDAISTEVPVNEIITEIYDNLELIAAEDIFSKATSKVIDNISGTEINGDTEEDEEEEETPASAKKKATTKKKEKKAPAPKKDKFSRDMAVTKAIKKLCKKKTGATFNEIYAEADEIYASHGNELGKKFNILVSNMLNTLVQFELMEKEDKQYRLV